MEVSKIESSRRLPCSHLSWINVQRLCREGDGSHALENMELRLAVICESGQKDCGSNKSIPLRDWLREEAEKEAVSAGHHGFGIKGESGDLPTMTLIAFPCE